MTKEKGDEIYMQIVNGEVRFYNVSAEKRAKAKSLRELKAKIRKKRQERREKRERNRRAKETRKYRTESQKGSE